MMHSHIKKKIAYNTNIHKQTKMADHGIETHISYEGALDLARSVLQKSIFCMNVYIHHPFHDMI